MCPLYFLSKSRDHGTGNFFFLIKLPTLLLMYKSYTGFFVNIDFFMSKSLKSFITPDSFLV